MFNPLGVIQALGGMANIRNQLNNFQQGLPQNGFDPKQQALMQAQQMLNSGQMSQQNQERTKRVPGTNGRLKPWRARVKKMQTQQFQRSHK